MITISAFKNVPDFAKGLVRDLRVRWALEEAGLAYQARLIELGEHKTPAYRAFQPFGQVPYFEEDGLVMFESDAIVLHIAERSEALMPRDRAGKARTQQWVVSALNTLEVVVQDLASLDLFYANEDWAKARRPQAEEAVKMRLGELQTALGDNDYLEGRFTAGDLMTAHVLCNLRHTPLLDGFANLAAYKARCEARPAYQRALKAQMADFAG